MKTDCDILIVGGGAGGAAAALASARNGKNVVLTEETDWIGGQLTAQAVPPDENPWIETVGGTRSYRALREHIRAYYRRYYPLTETARAQTFLNPGLGFVSRLCHEPRVALAALDAMLAPFLSSGRIRILYGCKPIGASVAGDRTQRIAFRDLVSGAEFDLSAPYVLDATETGELLPLTGTEFVVGSESRAQTGEPHASAGAALPENQQSVTHCFALSYHPGEEHVIDQPADYNRWKIYQPDFWPGPLLDWTDIHPATLQPRTYSLFGPSDNPAAFTDGGAYHWGQQGLWHYRRLRDSALFTDSGPDISLINWSQNDYWLTPAVSDNPLQEDQARREAKQLSLSLLYWLQTDAPHPTGSGRGYPGLKLRHDIVGSRDGLAKQLYIRESRRILAETTVLEQDISSEFRQEAEPYPDSVGIGCYRIDLHPSTGGDNYLDIGCCPFRIPLGALLPRRMENLIPAGKNIGTTHITNGAYRLHPVEWAIGEAAGCLAAFCLERGCTPREVRSRPALLADLQTLLRDQGLPLEWPQAHPI